MSTEKIKKAVIREDLLSITNDFRKAIILNQFIYWSERVADADKFIEKENEIAKNNGEGEKELFYGWIYKTAEELAEEVMLGLSASQIRRHINELVESGYISKRNNPKYKWDRTLQYRVNLVNIAKALKKNGYPLSDYKIDIPDESFSIAHPCAFNSAQMENQSCAHERAIPEITNIDYNTENTNKKDAFTNVNDRMDALKPKGYKGDGEKYNNKNNYTDKQLVAHITHTINSIMRNEYLISEDEEAGELNPCAELKKIILYFYREYNKTFAEKHPILSDISYGNIADRYMNPSGRKMSEDEVKDFATYKEMIDRYFATDFGRYNRVPDNFDYRISHFMSDNVRENLYLKMI